MMRWCLSKTGIFSRTLFPTLGSKFSPVSDILRIATSRKKQRGLLESLPYEFLKIVHQGCFVQVSSALHSLACLYATGERIQRERFSCLGSPYARFLTSGVSLTLGLHSQGGFAV